jgi:S1-C subfamily serine protease
MTVAGVVSGSPATRAALHAGDQITSVGSHKVTAPIGIQDGLERYHPENKISISWLDRQATPTPPPWSSSPARPPDRRPRAGLSAGA